MRWLALVFSATSMASSTVSTSTAIDAVMPRSDYLSSKKGGAESGETPELIGTLVQTHTGERVILDAVTPSNERFEALLVDRVTGQQHPIDPRLLDALRRLASSHSSSGTPVRIEIVSGFRSEKLNEMLRKKGHHVATHSQHSLGNAVDFRIGDMSPLDVERELRALGWDGGIGVYLSQGDWFTHADVGPNRRWNGQ
jgi:uncharacterized protein YcbK (DUF882 family)